jgi:hypothetical protein
MNVLDTLLLGLTVYACAGLSQHTTYFEDVITLVLIVFYFPTVAFGLILLLCVLIKLYRWLSNVVIKAKVQGCSISEPDDQLKPLLDDHHSDNANPIIAIAS